MSDEVSNWVERQLSKNPVFTIVVVAAIGVAFLNGVGVLRPVFHAGRWLGDKLGLKNSFNQPRGGSGVPNESQRRRGGL